MYHVLVMYVFYWFFFVRVSPEMYLTEGERLDFCDTLA